MGQGIFSRVALQAALIFGTASAVALAVGLSMGRAQESVPTQSDNELRNPPICSEAKRSDPRLKDICFVTPLDGGRRKIEIRLTAKTAPIVVCGYWVVAESYNDSYPRGHHQSPKQPEIPVA